MEVGRKTRKCSKLNRKCPTCKGDYADVGGKKVTGSCKGVVNGNKVGQGRSRTGARGWIRAGKCGICGHGSGSLRFGVERIAGEQAKSSVILLRVRWWTWVVSDFELVTENAYAGFRLLSCGTRLGLNKDYPCRQI